ncbi:MAG: hypothetical protein CMJ58_06885 [Planctomycetaceae bacterium]|nr:hypothetical protein [Planctomycetaceae bacterium]
MTLYQPITVEEQRTADKYPHLGEGPHSPALPTAIAAISQRIGFGAPVQTVTVARLRGLLAVLADCRRREFLLRDELKRLKQRLFEYEVDGLPPSLRRDSVSLSRAG